MSSSHRPWDTRGTLAGRPGVVADAADRESVAARLYLAWARSLRCRALMGGKSLSILVMNSRTNASRRVKFDRLPVTIGRHDYSHLQLLDPGVSRFHAVIEWTHPKVVVCDLGSVNGTFYEGMRLPPREPTTIDDDEFSIAVGPFHLAVSRLRPLAAGDPVAERLTHPSDLERLRRPDDGVTVIRSRSRR